MRRAEIATVAPRQYEFACHGGADSAGSADDPGDLAVQLHAGSPGHLELAHAEVAAAEAGLAVGEVELPHAAEGLVEALGVDAGPLAEEAFPPQAQGPGVVRPELTLLRHAQRGVGREGVVDRLQGRDDAAGEDVLLDPAEAAPGGEETVVVHGDGLDGDPAAGSEEPVKGREVGGPVGLPDGLDHLDADDGVVLAVDLAVVLHPHLDEPGQAGGFHPLTGQPHLLAGQGDRRDAGTSLRCADGKRAPSGADLQQPGAAAYAGEVENPVDLAQLCLLEPGCGLHGLALVEPRRGVGHRRVQEGGEQVVAQVVVSGDVAARTIKGVLLVMGDAPVDEDTQPLQGRRNQRGQPRGEGCQQVGQVGAGPGPPVPGHVGLTEPDLGIAAQPGEERRGANDLQFGRSRRALLRAPGRRGR